MSAKSEIIKYLEAEGNWCFGGKIEDYIRELTGSKSSTVARRCWELAEEGRIEKKLERVGGRGTKVVLFRLKLAPNESNPDSGHMPIKTYKIPSRSKRGVFYDVVDLGTEIICPCKGFQERGKCYHVKQAQYKARVESNLQLSL